MGVAGRKLSSTKKSIHQVVSKLKKIKKAQISINYWFIKYSFNWIKKEANKKLNKRTRGYNSSMARQWKMNIYATYGMLENLEPNSGAIEFGIGIVGQQNTDKRAVNDVRQVAKENGYMYNMPSDSKDDTGGWLFYLPDGTAIYTHGYGGKSFLYDTLIEYKDKKIYLEMYQKAFDKVMKGITK